MKLLIAYDGSDCSDAALDDLHRAGLPKEVEARVISIVEPATADVLYPVEALSCPMAWYPLQQAEVLPSPAKQVQMMRHMAADAADRLRHQFPAWTIDIATEYGLAGKLILERITTWKPDLVVMGSHGRQGFSRMALGSVSQYVVNHAHCAVRITHPLVRNSTDPIRLLVAMDASADAAHALQAVISRTWPIGTEAMVVGVVDAGIPLSIGISPAHKGETRLPSEEFRVWIAHAIRDASRDLQAVGINASPQILAGNPAAAITKQADDWNADCIFLGARGVGTIHRLLLGSVSSKVAADAHCSVEVIRRPANA
jgi:nucleotide-binding universal stress UspA family protein